MNLTREQINLINKYLTFQAFAQHGGLNHNFSSNGNIFCPFHPNSHTPSARLYNNENGQTLYCYTERRVYRPTDLVTHGILDMDLERIYTNLSDKLGIKDYTIQHHKLEIPHELLESFKMGQTTIKDFLISVLDK